MSYEPKYPVMAELVDHILEMMERYDVPLVAQGAMIYGDQFAIAVAIGDDASKKLRRAINEIDSAEEQLRKIGNEEGG